MASSGWEEVRRAKEENRHELVLHGPDVSQRIESDGLDPLIFQMASLNFLSISKTGLAEIPDDATRQFGLNSLTKLCIYENRLTSLPACFASVATLKHLDLSNNCLETLPDNLLTDLTALEVVNLSGNRLTSVPAVGQLPHLLDLYLSNNRLTALPEGIARPELANLLTVRAKNNSIDSLPDGLETLPCLRVLDLENNRVAEVSPALGNCGKLRELNLRSNPVADRRLRKMLEDGKVQCASVLEYLRKQLKSTGGGSKAKAKKPKGARGHSDSMGDSNAESIADVKPSVDVRHFNSASNFVAHVTEGAMDVRPYLVLCVIRNIDLHSVPGRFKAFLAMQQQLHDTIGDRRQKVTIATHDLDLVHFPLTFEALPPEEIVFKPLKGNKEESAADLFSRLRREAEEERKAKKRNQVSGVHRYLNLLEGRTTYPVLLDNERRVLSLPPITNADVSRVGQQTRHLLLEVSGQARLELCKQAMEQLVLWLLQSAFKDDPANERGLALEQARVVDWLGGLRVVFPARTDLTACEASCRLNRMG